MKAFSRLSLEVPKYQILNTFVGNILQCLQEWHSKVDPVLKAGVTLIMLKLQGQSGRKTAKVEEGKKQMFKLRIQ